MRIQSNTLIVAFLMTLTTHTAMASTPLSVTKFQNKVGSVSCDYQWGWWSHNIGDAFQDMLITELLDKGGYEVLERAAIQEIYEGEHNLVNAEADQSLQKNQFKKAKYTIVGSVSDFEYCAQEKKTGFNLRAIAHMVGDQTGLVDVLPEINFSKAHAKVVIDLRVIDVTTGRILQSIKTEGSAERRNFRMQNRIIDIEQAKNSPAGDASRQAIQKAVAQLKIK